ncbi:MAG TPA: hypothetical protein VFH42_03970, partial [Sporolactobacillaceae bacterium]|nr:hypothetical protein [Sporolactobacillaceae bacterium]
EITELGLHNAVCPEVQHTLPLLKHAMTMRPHTLCNQESAISRRSGQNLILCNHESSILQMYALNDFKFL